MSELTMTVNPTIPILCIEHNLANDEDTSIELPDAFWTNLIDVLPEEGSWKRVRERIRETLQTVHNERIDMEEEAKEEEAHE